MWDLLVKFWISKMEDLIKLWFFTFPFIDSSYLCIGTNKVKYLELEDSSSHL